MRLIKKIGSSFIYLIKNYSIYFIMTAVIIVRMQLGDGFTHNGSYAGSGTFINNNGDILTARHVINDMKTVYVRIGHEHFLAKVIFSDSKTDVAVIHINVHNSSHYGIAKVLKEGEPITAKGYALGKVFTTTHGVLLKLNSYLWGWGWKIKASLYVCMGMSGGPILDNNNTITGELSGGYFNSNYDHCTSNTFYESAQYIISDLQAHGVSYDNSENGKDSDIVLIWGPAA